MFKSKSRLAIFSDTSMDKEEPPSPPKVEEIKQDTSGLPAPPSPSDFDAFVPWVCLQWHIHDPVLVKITRDEYPKAPKPKAGKIKSNRSQAKSTVSTQKASPIPEPSKKTVSEKFEETLCIPVTAYYDGRTGDLVWISITNYRLKINKKLIQAFNICAPYHPYLSKLTFRNCTLTSSILLEISNMLFDSNITEISFDDTFLPEANYYILLDDMSQLRYLSLSRCRLNDTICTKIIQRMHSEYPASKSLQLLDLGSNYITDVGAEAIGLMLRNNRYLLHLNLSGNKITDDGFSCIMNALKEFALSRIEITDMKRERMRFLKNKTAVYRRCLNEVKRRKTVTDAISIFSRKSMANIGSATKKPRKSMAAVSDTRKPEVIADLMATRIVGEFKGTYGLRGVIQKDGYYYAKGNFTLCSINFAYNNLDFFSVKRLCDVLAYQSVTLMVPPATGLVRVVIDGNNIPNACPELDNITMYLKQVGTDHGGDITPPKTGPVAKKKASVHKMKTRRTP